MIMNLGASQKVWNFGKLTASSDGQHQDGRSRSSASMCELGPNSPGSGRDQRRAVVNTTTVP